MGASWGAISGRHGTTRNLVSWAKRCPQTRQSGKKNTTGKAGKGSPWLNGVLGEIAASASRTGTFLGERYRRLARRRGKRKALAAIARSVLVIIFHLLADPAARFRDLGPDYYDSRISRERKISNHLRQPQALGLTVTIAEAAQPHITQPQTLPAAPAKGLSTMPAKVLHFRSVTIAADSDGRKWTLVDHSQQLMPGIRNNE
jgi:Transposase IS116/IS110/IS902 family